MKTKPENHPQLTLRKLAAGFENLARCFSECLGQPFSEHTHVEQLTCGGEVTINYRHFSNATVVETTWSKACGCKNDPQETQCDKELTSWVDTIQEREAEYFHFQRESSLMLNLDESTTLIFRADQEAMR